MQTYRLIPFFLLILLAGCSALKFVEESPVTAQLLVQQGTMRYIESSDDYPGKAARVAEVALEIRDVAEGDLFTLAELRERALELANLDELPPSDQILAAALIDAIAERVERKTELDLPTGELDLVVFDQVIDWVLEAAAAYG